MLQANGGKLFPLKVKSWMPVVGNIGNASFCKSLEDQGYQRSSSTLWILDGLLECLAPENVVKLLKVHTSVCLNSHGSITVETFCTFL